jgi:phage host-nuclease inhibitor protein Gam
MALGILPGDLDSTAKAFANLKTELDKEKAAREIAQIEVDTLTEAVKDVNIIANKFATQIPTLEDNIKHLENKVVDWLKKSELRNSAWSARLWRTMTTRNKTLS